MIASFKEFIDNIIIESLHPELKSIVTSSNSGKSKQSQLADKIKDLSSRGESTGIEGNMPKGSSRAYMQHSEPEKITLDNKPASIKTGTKVAIRSPLEKFHNAKKYDGRSLGQLQNEAEGGDHFTNDRYRILTHNHETGKYKTNHEYGIFPPLINHDHENHQWSHVGHVKDVKSKEFGELTKTKSHPKGISHDDFVNCLVRDHDRNHGKYWTGSNEREAHLDHVEEHPLVQKFLDHQRNYGSPPHDYRQIKNLGVFEHPDGSKHIVARDHGFNSEVQGAYKEVIKRKYGG